MPRTLSSNFETAVESQVVRPVILCALETTGSTIRLTSHMRDITYDSNSYLGNSYLRPFTNIREATDLSANGCDIVLGGYDSTALAAVLSTLTQSKTGTLWIGLLDTSYALIDAPIVVFKGLYDYGEIKDNGRESEIALHYASRLSRQRRGVEFRYTDQSQQALYSGDLGFQYAADAADWSGFWGRAGRPTVIRRRRVGGR